MTTRTLRRLSALDHPLLIGLTIFIVLLSVSLASQAHTLFATPPPIILIVTPTPAFARSALARSAQPGVLHASKGVAPTLRAAPDPTAAPTDDQPAVADQPQTFQVDAQASQPTDQIDQQALTDAYKALPPIVVTHDQLNDPGQPLHIRSQSGRGR